MVSTLTQLLWFIFIGWWAGPIWFVTALVVMCTIIGWPLALWMFYELPNVVALSHVD